jgi:acetyl-CoA carboxylase biotin carboxylase subunit
MERSFAHASLEAEKAFGNPALYLEKFLSGGRHVEFQVLCDAFGNGLHLGERECSIQRKHQKLFEEAPSPVVEEDLRLSLGGKVADAAALFGYRNAGTVEFLRDEEGSFYFMEMNTRLQVEHPVTEMITSVDLVAEQLKIAANRPLGLRQEEIAFRGQAMEFRINAEDPDQDFKPDPGLIASFSPPRVEEPQVAVRWDSAVRAGYRIPPHYDSLVGKLIIHGPNRVAVLRGAEQALNSLTIEGVRTTIPFHLRLLANDDFRAGRYDVNFLERSGLGAKG